MKFLLVSRGPLSEVQEAELKKLISRDFTGLKLLFCPTAANKENGDKPWVVDDLNKFKDLGFEIDICDLNGADKANLLGRFEQADVLYFEGGDTPWLREAIKASGIEEHLPRLLETRVWLGTSAGGCVLSPVFYESCAEWFKDASLGLSKGLGLINFQFLPHLNSRHFPENTIANIENVKKNLAEVGGKKLYCIDDTGAVSVNGDEIKVFGGESFQL